MTTSYRAWAAPKAGAPLEPFEYDPGPLGAEEVEITVEHCGVCHSDLSMLDNEWGFTAYPFVPGHEAVGRVAALGENAKGVAIGQRVGLGWNINRGQIRLSPPNGARCSSDDPGSGSLATADVHQNLRHSDDGDQIVPAGQGSPSHPLGIAGEGRQRPHGYRMAYARGHHHVTVIVVFALA